MDVLKELRYFRQDLRDFKADNLREMRYYQQEGYGEGIVSFMSGMARGKVAALARIEYLIKRMEDECGNS